MSRADDFARKLMENAGGGQFVVSTGDSTADDALLAPTVGNDLTALPVERLQRGRYQPRGAIDPASLTELADSIRAQGVVQPLVVRAIGSEGRFEIVAGERRWRAAQLAGLTAVPVVIRELDDLAAMAFALIENIQREKLNPLEEANALRTLSQQVADSTGTAPTQQALSVMVGKSVPWVSKRLALLERPESVQQAVVSGALSVDAAARRPDSAGASNASPDRTPRKSRPRPAVRVDLNILQSSVQRLNALAGSLGLPGVDLPNKPARKDYIAAFEQRIVEILDAAHRSINPE